MDEAIAAYLRRCRELARFCTQNGWIDNDSLAFEVRPLAGAPPGEVEVAVKFTEVVMKGAGCEGRRVPCFAVLSLVIDAAGEVRGARSL